MLIASLAQLCSTPDIDANLSMARKLAMQAKESGSRWLLFPECTPYLGPDARGDGAVQPLDGEIPSFFQQLARDTGLYITLGSFHEASPHPDRAYNTQLFISPEGQLLATYRKLHLFDVTFANGSSLRESDSYVPGDQIVTHDLPSVDEPDHDEAWRVGCSICYDLRFPYLYQSLVRAGAEMITVPSAFTLETGRDHWHPLLQARAIETQCYVLAPNQLGNHFGARHSYGHSSIYDPWGRLLASAPDRACVISAEIDHATLSRIRSRLPCQQHVRHDIQR